MKIRPVAAELFHTVRRTDMTKLVVAFRNFGNAPKKKFETHERCYCLKHVMDGHSMTIVYGRYFVQLLMNASYYNIVFVLPDIRHHPRLTQNIELFH